MMISTVLGRFYLRSETIFKEVFFGLSKLVFLNENFVNFFRQTLLRRP